MAEIKVIIYSIGNSIKPYMDKEFIRRDLILDCSRYDQYTGQKRENYPRIEFNNKNAELLDGVNVGDLVSVTFELRGRFFERRDGSKDNMTTSEAYKIEVLKSASELSKNAPVVQKQEVVQAPQPKVEEQDPLPF